MIAKRRKRSRQVKAWLKQELKEQQERYKKIVAEMEALSPQREQWIEEFFQRIQTRGFCVHKDIRRRIKPEEIPPRPKRKLRVVY
ncbi:MAG: hypothetical protein QXP01_04930 [Candidatus Hadarchaeum sp.]